MWLTCANKPYYGISIRGLMARCLLITHKRGGCITNKQKKQYFIETQIKRINRNQFILAFTLTAIGIWMTNYNLSQIEIDAVNVIGLLIGLYLLYKGLPRLIKFILGVINFERHNVYKSLAVYGEYEEVAQGINSEVHVGGAAQYGLVVITNSWIMKLNTFSLDVIHVADVVWTYEGETTHRQSLYGLPGQDAGKTYTVMIHTRNPLVPTLEFRLSHINHMDDSERVIVDGIEKKEKIRNILVEISHRNPHVIMGYSSELATMWEQDRHSFIQQIDNVST